MEFEGKAGFKSSGIGRLGGLACFWKISLEYKQITQDYRSAGGSAVKTTNCNPTLRIFASLIDPDA